ncbi:MAG: hypothetical protein ABWJ97_03960 [Thermoproteus sp.]
MGSRPKDGARSIYEVLASAASGLPFLALAALLFIPVETTWGVRVVLELEMFPTQNRGTIYPT